MAPQSLTWGIMPFHSHIMPPPAIPGIITAHRSRKNIVLITFFIIQNIVNISIVFIYIDTRQRKIFYDEGIFF